MPIELRIALVIALLAVAIAAGLVWKARTGRARLVRSGELVDLTKLAAQKHGQTFTKFGRKATLLQFSTEVCSVCKQTAKFLSDLEKKHPELVHLEVDITNRLDLAAHFGVLQTPTTLVLNPSGRVVARIGGAPKPLVIQHELEKLDIK